MTTEVTKYQAWIKDLDTCEYGHNLLVEIKRLQRAGADTEHEVQQILGKVLNFPWFKDDQKNFPGSTEEDGVCVGANVAATLAMEVATTIDILKTHLQGFLAVNDGECRFDHHGYCQTHYIEKPCRVAEAREFMESLEKR